jgi:hypothetical protein
MKKWATINADPLHSIIFNNAGNKLIYNLLHKVKVKLLKKNDGSPMKKIFVFQNSTTLELSSLRKEI